MTRSISRQFYRPLLFLYPAAFRREFGDDMLSMLAECTRTQGCCCVFADVLLSAAKQQVYQLSAALSTRAVLSPELGSPPILARMLATAALGLGLIACVFVRAKPETPESSTWLRSEALFWFPIAGWERYCADVPQCTGTAEGALATGVFVARKGQDPESWMLVRIACGRYWSDARGLTGEPNSFLAAQINRSDRSRLNHLRTTPN
jgi:hypothetical protein